jgi:hypothetical protein
VEAADIPAGRERIGRSERLEDQVARRFADAVQHICPAAQALLDTFREINRPAERPSSLVDLEVQPRGGNVAICQIL